MVQIQVYGRNSGDTWTAGSLIAEALRGAGRDVRVGTWRGARHAMLTIHARQGDEPADAAGCRSDAAIVLAADLLAGLPAAELARPRLIVIDAPAAPCRRLPGAAFVHAVDATTAAAHRGVAPVVTLLGAFAAVGDLVPIPELLASIERRTGALGAASVAACLDAYDEAMDAARR